MLRYLINVSYIGTAFKGVTFIEPYYRYHDLRTIQGVLEKTMKMYFKQRCEVCCSSRTDARVHALNSTFTFDIVQNGKELQLDTKKYEILAALNDHLKFQNVAIRINDISGVDEKTFLAYRNVKSRTYMYRIAITSKNKTDECVFPIEEVDRCYFVESDTFDIEKFKRSAQLFVGSHDFRSFMKYSREKKTQEACYAQRRIYSITVQPTKSATIPNNSGEKHFQYYDITITASSFVYRQIRKMIGALCACAQGHITERDIYELITIPSYNSWKMMEEENLVEVAPPDGLYFIDINYKSEEEWTLQPREMSARGLRMKTFLKLLDKDNETDTTKE